MDLKIPFFDDSTNIDYTDNDIEKQHKEYIDFFKGLPDVLQIVIRKILKVDSILMGGNLENGHLGLITIQRSHIFSQSIIELCNNYQIDWPEKDNHFKKYSHLLEGYYSNEKSDSVIIEGIGGWNRFYVQGNNIESLLKDISMRISGSLTVGGLEGSIEEKEIKAKNILKEYEIKPFN